ncbi:unnamed protein product [Acanthoscelides obtectus]|uniref:Uncharacterized protein n=1 Tax=Acanthoscelides obtectus TaxID=200917 RepID=A0A9P0K825_ACAOB|nr:unnamed protein product [Acanthoscelides obtectus]CAK1655365.1 hypothetical protein AOBTE_LOCUS19155 [Acanthoscelides obtectus]
MLMLWRYFVNNEHKISVAVMVYVRCIVTIVGYAEVHKVLQN